MKPTSESEAEKDAENQKRIDEAIAESFPASDAPSYTSGAKPASAEEAKEKSFGNQQGDEVKK